MPHFLSVITSMIAIKKLEALALRKYNHINSSWHTNFVDDKEIILQKQFRESYTTLEFIPKL